MPDEQDPAAAPVATPPETTSWMNDVQRGLAWLIIIVFMIATLGPLARTVISADIQDVTDILKQALAVLFNIVMLVLGYFFGSSKSSQSKDDTQNRILDKLTPTPPPPAPAAMTSDQIALATLKNGELTYYQTLGTEEAKAKFLAMTPEERLVAIGRG